MEFRTKIGMEIHVHPKTKSKMFCRCANEFKTEEPNKNICEVCTGQPGTLPVINEKAVEAIIKAGLALGSEINRKVHWDRKHYFYPDLPKGYQITQNDTPLCEGGTLRFEYEDEKGQKQEKTVEINRLHLEEDAGKDLHPAGADYSLVDFNRAGVPLIELVTEPVIENKEQAVAFCKALQQIFRYTKVSDADMEKGQMRCEVNISLGQVKEDGSVEDGTKVEIKNINSFKGVARSISYEMKRQKKLLEEGEKVVQETRGWSAEKQKTISQRTKESAQDYRYFPEPDLPPVNVSDEFLDKIKRSLGEMPEEKKKRFIEQMGVSVQMAEVLISDLALANYFENVASEIEEWLREDKKDGLEVSGKKVEEEEARIKINQLASNYLVVEVKTRLDKSKKSAADLKVTPENFAELMVMVFKNEINSSGAQAVLYEMLEKGGDPSEIVKTKNLALEEDSSVIENAVAAAIADNVKAVADFKAGKEQAVQFLLGQVMAKTKGKAEPKQALELIRKKLEEA